jgi:gamma-glutamyltranspeptidase/glutathione hydrolase
VALNITTASADPLALDANAIVRPVTASGGMVVTSEPIATRIGVDVLRDGGNAVDAAVTIGFALAVVRPRAGNIGGGGFMLIKRRDGERVEVIDYRETAPAAAHRDMFLDADGNADPQKSRFSHLSAGVPGTVAGLALALEQAGTISLGDALRPAIDLAENGFIVSGQFAGNTKAYEKRLKQWPASAAVFFKAGGAPYEAGDVFRQPQLAGTLRAIAENGPSAFYEGETATLIEREMRAHGGLITRADMAAYQPRMRHAVHGTYRSYDVYSMSPPSSGGVHIVQILNILDGFDLAAAGHNSAQSIHWMAEAMKRAYADRSVYLGDPDFANVPVAGLTAKDYAEVLRRGITDTATPSQEIKAGTPPGWESDETTHFSIVDRHDNAVSNTYTINFGFGSGIVVPGTGFLLNNEMDDFSAKPGVPNAYGLIGGTANAVAPNKRMLSSMSPTIVLKDGEPFLVTGSPGGSRIITTTLQVIVNVIDFDMNLQEAVNAPRVHHQWLPDELRLEHGISADTVALLKFKGHGVKEKSVMGAANSILVDVGRRIFHGAGDPRRGGVALGLD